MVLLCLSFMPYGARGGMVRENGGEGGQEGKGGGEMEESEGEKGGRGGRGRARSRVW